MTCNILTKYELLSLIINGVLAIATFFAVFVALWQTKYNNRKKLKLDFTDNLKVAIPNSNEFKHYIALQVANVGNRKVTIKNWGFGVKKEFMLMVPSLFKDPVLELINKDTPYKLDIEETADFCFPIDNFKVLLKDIVTKGMLSEKEHLIFKVHDSVGQTYTVKTKKTIKELME